MQERQGLVGHDRLDIEVMGRDLALREHVLFLFHNQGCFIVFRLLSPQKRPAVSQQASLNMNNYGKATYRIEL